MKARIWLGGVALVFAWGLVSHGDGGVLHDRAKEPFLAFRHETQAKPCVAGESICSYVELLYLHDLAAASNP